MRVGWIKLHRALIDSKLWSCSDATLRVALYLVLEANREPDWVKRRKIERGQLARSALTIAENCGLSRKAVRHALKVLEQDSFITLEYPFGANRGPVITICKYALFQNKEEAEGANEGNNQGSNQGSTDLNKKERKKEDTPCSPSKTKPEKHDQAVAEAEIPKALQEMHGFHEAWQMFVDDRKERKRYMTANAVKLTLKKLKDNAKDSVEMLETAVQCGWTGVWEPSKKKKEESMFDENGNLKPKFNH